MQNILTISISFLFLQAWKEVSILEFQSNLTCCIDNTNPIVAPLFLLLQAHVPKLQMHRQHWKSRGNGKKVREYEQPLYAFLNCECKQPYEY